MEYICKSRACDDRDGSKHKVKSSLRPDIELPVPSCGGSWTLWPASAAQTGRAGSFLLTRCRQTSRHSVIAAPCQGTTSQLGDSCQTEERTTCVTTANTTGKMEVSYQSGACCLDR